MSINLNPEENNSTILFVVLSKTIGKLHWINQKSFRFLFYITFDVLQIQISTFAFSFFIVLIFFPLFFCRFSNHLNTIWNTMHRIHNIVEAKEFSFACLLETTMPHFIETQLKRIFTYDSTSNRRTNAIVLYSTLTFSITKNWNWNWRIQMRTLYMSCVSTSTAYLKCSKIESTCFNRI